MKLDKQTQEEIQELQASEQGLQNILFQKQAFQLEFNETESVINETTNSKGEIYKLSGQVMFLSSKEEILKELKEKKEIFQLRLKALEKQESSIREKTEELRKNLDKKFSEGRINKD